jgi:hypothetical protein
LTQSLSPDERTEHRQKIAFEVEVIMHSYWQSLPPPQIKAGILADWCDALEDWKQEQIVWALRKWRNDNPDKRPNPGHIVAICKKARGMKLAKEARQSAQPQEPQRKPIDREAAARIMAEAGFTPRTFGQ